MAEKQELEQFRDALSWALHWIVACGCVPNDVPNPLPMEIEEFENAAKALDRLEELVS